jgi:hypothetical protein
MEIPLDWEYLEKSKRKISLLINNPLPEHKGKGMESYVGIVAAKNDEFITLTTEDNKRLDGICVRLDMILSVWIYKE